MSGGHGPMRVYSVLIGLYPRRFRDEYGADLVQLMRDQCADEPRWRVYSRAALDLAITIPAQQLETRMTRNPNHLVPLLYTALAVGGALFAMVGGTNATMLVVGLCMAVAAGAMAIVSWRRAAPISAAVTTSGWWKLVVAGPCLIAAVIIGGARTPIGKLSGGLASFAATDLGGFAIKAALQRAGLTAEQVDYVFMGHVLQAGAGQITARQAAANAGIPMTVPATTINKVCLSGLNAIYLADQLIQYGDADVVVAGGMESMTKAP